MTLEEMLEMMEELGYTYDMVAEKIGFPVDKVRASMHLELEPTDYNILLSLSRYFKKLKENQNMIRESAVYEVSSHNKTQGEYTIDDYYDLPDERRVELIDGVFYDMGAPTLRHQDVIGEVYRQISNYIRKKKGKCKVYFAPADVQLDCSIFTMVQPDVFIVCDKDKLNIQRVHGAPEWVMEVLSPSTKNKDLTIKLKKYKNAGVREYWIVDPKEQTVTVYDFQSRFPMNYTFEEQIPIAIYDGELKVDMTQINLF